MLLGQDHHGEGSDGEPFSATAAWYFIQNTGVHFKVLRDYKFEALFGAIDGDGDRLPNQFILAPGVLTIR